jgi:hypothetical protein
MSALIFSRLASKLSLSMFILLLAERDRIEGRQVQQRERGREVLINTLLPPSTHARHNQFKFKHITMAMQIEVKDKEV